MRTASTSRPESVSSRIASFGLSKSICKISAFFFSPPEKPTFRSRSEYDGSICKSSIACLSSFLKSQRRILLPRFFSRALRINDESESPGTSRGLWNERKIPSFDLLSGVSSLMFFPLKSISPELSVYLGLPISANPSVDLPAPLAPIIPMRSPRFTSRFTPSSAKNVSPFVYCLAPIL